MIGAPSSLQRATSPPNTGVSPAAVPGLVSSAGICSDRDAIGNTVARGRATRKGLKVGICGEHGGDPSSIHFFHKAGLNYVSRSLYRIPVARLAAAQAALSVKVGD